MILICSENDPKPFWRPIYGVFTVISNTFIYILYLYAFWRIIVTKVYISIYFYTLKDTKPLIFTPKRYDEHPRPSTSGRSPREPSVDFLLILMKRTWYYLIWSERDQLPSFKLANRTRAIAMQSKNKTKRSKQEPLLQFHTFSIQDVFYIIVN